MRPPTADPTSEPSMTGGTIDVVRTRPRPRLHRSRIATIAAPMGGTRVVTAAFSGMIATALWIAMFTVGMSVPSEPFRKGLLAIAGTPVANAFQVNSAADAIYALGVITFSYTPTNLAMLCCLASLIGCLGHTATTEPEALARAHRRRLTAARTEAAHAELNGEPTPRANIVDDELDAISLRPAVCAVTWGFFIYLFLISGTLLTTENPFSNPSPDQYLRLAGTASLLAFVVGWRPQVITKLVAQVGQSRMGGSASDSTTRDKE